MSFPKSKYEKQQFPIRKFGSKIIYIEANISTSVLVKQPRIQILSHVHWEKLNHFRYGETFKR